MIITISGADFSASNIGTLSTWTVSKSIGAGAEHSIPSYVDKNSAFNYTITLKDGYTFGTYSVTMGGEDITSTAMTVSETSITINIASVTGVIKISVATINSSTGEEDSGSTDITNLFTFSLTKTAYKISDGGTNTSTYLDSCNPVNISEYAGQVLLITLPQFTTTAGGTSGYGLIFYDSNGTMLTTSKFPIYTSSGPKGAYSENLITIPSNAETVVTSIFNSDSITNSVYDGTVDDFSCFVYEISNETDITSLFDFDTTGYAWRVSDDTITSYSTKYWNSDTVDVSSYAGKMAKINTPVFRTTQNNQGPYGFAYEDADGNKYKLHQFELLNDGGTLLAGDVTEKMFKLPNNISKLLVCYYSDEMYNAANPITEEIRNGFYCKIVY